MSAAGPHTTLRSTHPRRHRDRPRRPPRPTLQVVAKISVGEAPDLIKLAKTEHLTPIEERIKDLHESMNARQHAHAAPLCWCCPLLPPGQLRRLSMARLSMRGDSARPA